MECPSNVIFDNLCCCPDLLKHSDGIIFPGDHQDECSRNVLRELLNKYKGSLDGCKVKDLCPQYYYLRVYCKPMR